MFYGLTEWYDVSGGFLKLAIAWTCSCGWQIDEIAPRRAVTVIDLRRLRELAQSHAKTGLAGAPLEELVRS